MLDGPEAFAGDRPASSLDKDDIRESLPLAFAAHELGIPVDPAGKARCPWHNDRNPSFQLYTDGNGIQKFACPVCDISGDVYDLIRLQEGGGFAAAVVQASKMLDVLPDDFVLASAPPRPPFDPEAAMDYFHACNVRAHENEGWGSVALGLTKKDDPQDHRATTDHWLMKTWMTGIGPDGESTFPHFNSAGQITGIKIRALNGARWAFPGSAFGSLYGVWRPRTSRYLLLCEGETDTIWADMQGAAVDVYGLPRGAGAFQHEWAELEANIVFLAFDADEAGDGATLAWRNAFLARRIDHRVLPIPAGEDLRSWAPDLKVVLTQAARYGIS